MTLQQHFLISERPHTCPSNTSQAPIIARRAVHGAVPAGTGAVRQARGITTQSWKLFPSTVLPPRHSRFIATSHLMKARGKQEWKGFQETDSYAGWNPTINDARTQP